MDDKKFDITWNVAMAFAVAFLTVALVALVLLVVWVARHVSW